MTSWQRLRRSIAAVMVTALLMSMAGCGEEIRRDHGATALIIGNRQNAAVPQLAAENKAVDAAIGRGDRFFVIAESGTPDEQPGVDQTAECVKFKSAIACNKVRDDFKTGFAANVQGIQAGSPEASLMKSLYVAGRALNGDNSGDITGPKQLIIVDSGIDTAPPLSMRDLDVLNWDPRVVIDAIKEAKNTLPNLKGVKVQLIGLGAVADPQKPLTGDQQSKLIRLWRIILTESGAQLTNEHGSEVPEPVEARTDLKPAYRVHIAKRKPSPPPAPCKTFSLNEAALGFKPNVATFYDKEKARKVVAKYAKDLIRAGVGVALTGTTAYPETDPRNPISNARAEAVRDLLIDLGVPKSKIVTQGVGINFPRYKDPHGDPVAEIKMRLVIVDPLCPTKS